MTLPETVASALERLRPAPPNADVSIVLRHAERHALPPGGFGSDVALTEYGVATAQQLGRMLGERNPGGVHSSPILRCMKTGQHIIEGAGWNVPVTPDPRLGWPGPFVVDEELSGPLFLKLGSREVVRQQLETDSPPDGMRPTDAGVRILLELAADPLRRNGRTFLHVTHDSVLAVIVGRLFNLGLEDFRWPEYLDALLLWKEAGDLRISWRGLDQASYPFSSPGN